MARRWEWEQQVLLASLLDRWLPADAFWTATDPVAPSAMSGLMRRRRGVKRGTPDCLVWCRRTRPIGIEMKSPGGRCSPAQKAVRLEMIAAGCVWWESRSANGAMVALAESGVKFRKIVHADGTVERWKKPRLADWEKPRRDPAEPRPLHPVVAAERRAARQRWRERQQGRETPPISARVPSNRATS